MKWAEHKGMKIDLADIPKYNYVINRQSHRHSRPIWEIIVHTIFKHHTWLHIVQFSLVQLFPKSESNVCDYLY